jgi:hypothetical protein
VRWSSTFQLIGIIGSSPDRTALRTRAILQILLLCSWLVAEVTVQRIRVDATGGPSRLEVQIAPNPIIAEGSENSIVFVSLYDSLGRPAKALREIELEVSSSDLGVGKIPRGSWKIAKGAYYGRVNFSCTMILEFEPNFREIYRFGSTTITASADGLTSGQATLTTILQGGPASILRTYSGVPKIPALAGVAPLQVQVLDSDGNPTRPLNSFKVTLSASLDVVEFVSGSWQWERDFLGYVSYMEDYAKGKSPGLANITASAPGFESDSATVEVVPSDFTSNNQSTYTSSLTPSSSFQEHSTASAGQSSSMGTQAQITATWAFGTLLLLVVLLPVYLTFRSRRQPR